MSEEYVIDHAAPTLAGLKTGNLFPCKYDSYDCLRREICAVNRQLGPKGLRLIPLRRNEEQALLYLYRPARLEKDLQNADAAALLKSQGYDEVRPDYCLRRLMGRLQRYGDFPHEIGLFLSYPPEDVRGFMEHRGHDSKCDGCWKVYGDVDKAQKLFRAYKNCTDCYHRRKAMGASMAGLAVAG